MSLSTRGSILLMLLIPLFQVNAQHRFDFGLMSGLSYYNGDINSSRIFYSPGIAYGAVINYTFNTRYLLRWEICKGNISGNDMDFADAYRRTIRKAAFSASVIDFSTQIEFNFLPYINISKLKKNYSFFTTTGIGCALITNATYNVGPHITVPIGVGFKYLLIKRLTIGTEWTYHKTFNDGVDGVINWRNDLYKSGIHNFDWYSFCCVYFTYKIFYSEANCPVYWNLDQ